MLNWVTERECHRAYPTRQRVHSGFRDHRSPRPPQGWVKLLEFGHWSKITSGGRRESEQLNATAKGFCPADNRSRVSVTAFLRSGQRHIRNRLALTGRIHSRHLLTPALGARSMTI
jgi:hypothetical protein